MRSTNLKKSRVQKPIKTKKRSKMRKNWLKRTSKQRDRRTMEEASSVAVDQDKQKSLKVTKMTSSMMRAMTQTMFAIAKKKVKKTKKRKTSTPKNAIVINKK
jgi:hypothetical protein